MCERESGGLRSTLGLRKIQDGVKVPLRKRKPKHPVKASVSSRSTRFGVKESEQLYSLVKMDLKESRIKPWFDSEMWQNADNRHPFGYAISAHHDLIARNMFGLSSKK